MSSFGDLFLSELLGAPGDPYGPQRRALFGCAVDGLRAVYDATAKVHGPLEAPNFPEIDLSRSVANGTCWSQQSPSKADISRQQEQRTGERAHANKQASVMRH